MIKNETLLELADRYGAPLYLYDSNIIQAQYKRLIKAFKSVADLKIHFACKSLPNLTVLKLMKKMGAGLDTVSIQEARLGLMAGFDASEIIYTPNGVSLQEIEDAKNLGVIINIDNIDTLEEFGQRNPGVPVCIRINPHIMAGGNQKISVGHIDSKFGISIHQLPHILRVVENTQMKINGVHMHTGSDILDIDVFSSAAELLFDTAKNFKDLEFIDLGSGFKVPYQKGSDGTDIESLGKAIGKKFDKFCTSYGRPLRLVFEPGKFLVSEAGKFLTKVNVIKQTTSTVFAGVDSGFNHLARPMLYDAYHHIHNISNPSGKPRYYTVVGYICETDTFGVNRKISEIKQGDVLCFDNAGAYCFSMTSNYNSRFRPAEVLFYKGEGHLIRKRETLEDLTRNQVVVDLD